jgi:hypothetical protein
VTLVPRIPPPCLAELYGVFVSDGAAVNLAYPVARERLGTLAADGRLFGVSGQAYAEGLAAMVRVGPFGDVLGASKLVQMRMLEPVPRGDGIAIPLRWEATGPMGRLFPVLDADLVLTPSDGESSQLALTGAYRPPLGRLGARLDRAVLHRAAAATIRSLLKQAAQLLAEPEGDTGEVTVLRRDIDAKAAAPLRGTGTEACY